ncbi:hypothetical protein F1559_002930 [Cyanidiococcus yangmingshanensis]|uniref:C2H2-type domain-containing protein n=1 Tax=Cyanidiococcus yangmingshanensis TaxID=2690220 RepID=A0A7J7IFM0_9RHOD|nr:hypothetical protein F1559_002930 [Cyanidiococcus yangmingshanensis]
MERERGDEATEAHGTGATPSSWEPMAFLLGSSPPAHFDALPSLNLCLSPQGLKSGTEPELGKSECLPAASRASAVAELETAEQCARPSRDESCEDNLSMSSSSTSFATNAHTGTLGGAAEQSEHQVQTGNSSGKRFICQRCSRDFSTMSHLRRHARDVHQNMRKFACNLCGTAFKRRQHLESHHATFHCKGSLSSAPEGDPVLGLVNPMPIRYGTSWECSRSSRAGDDPSGPCRIDLDKSLPPLNPIDDVSRRMAWTSMRPEHAGGTQEKRERGQSCGSTRRSRRTNDSPEVSSVEYLPPVDWLSEPRSTPRASSTGSMAASSALATEDTSRMLPTDADRQDEIPTSIGGDRMSFFTNHSNERMSPSGWAQAWFGHSDIPERARSQSDPIPTPPSSQILTSLSSHETEHVNALTSVPLPKPMSGEESPDPEMMRILDAYTRNVCFAKLFEDNAIPKLDTDPRKDSLRCEVIQENPLDCAPVPDELHELVAHYARRSPIPENTGDIGHASLPSSSAQVDAIQRREPSHRSLYDQSVPQTQAVMAPVPLPTNLYTYIPMVAETDARSWHGQPMTWHERGASISAKRACETTLPSPSTGTGGANTPLETTSVAQSNHEKEKDEPQNRGAFRWGVL